MLGKLTEALVRGQEGHAVAGIAALIPAAGAVLLTIGAAGDTDWLIWVGGIVLAVGVVAANLAEHMGVDYGIFDRLTKLEGK